MDVREFELFLERMEDQTLDFKSKMYDLSYDHEKAKFIKDIVSMANTPREETSYIIVGVKKKVNGSYELNGLDKYIDEATLQSQFKDRVYPIPLFFLWNNILQ